MTDPATPPVDRRDEPRPDEPVQDEPVQDEPGQDEPGQDEPGLRPQTLLLAFMGIHLYGREVAVYSGSVIDTLGRLGISEEAVRSTLARMSRRGLLERHRRGRRAYFALTPRSTSMLADGHRRMWRTSPVNRDWDGRWTLVGFSLPESWRQQRHDLRSRLVWGGFGPLQNGLWIAPAVVDVPALIGDLRLDEHIRAFVAETVKPTEAAQFVREAFDIDGLATRYRLFLARWGGPRPLPELPDDLVRELLLQAEWLQLVRRDPRLPIEHLPPGWPAVPAEKVFHELSAAFRAPAARLAAGMLDLVPVPPQERAETRADDGGYQDTAQA